MFLVGTEFRSDHFRARYRSALSVSAAGIAAPFVLVFLLPMFFAFSGLNTRLGLVVQPALMLGAMAIGALMNARGLMELILINIGLQAGVILPGLFSILVLMAIVTMLMATPLFNWIMRKQATVSRSAARPAVHR